jgi:hypothetical protein
MPQTQYNPGGALSRLHALIPGLHYEIYDRNQAARAGCFA